jgi:hypothetical protein
MIQEMEVWHTFFRPKNGKKKDSQYLQTTIPKRERERERKAERNRGRETKSLKVRHKNGHFFLPSTCLLPQVQLSPSRRQSLEQLE